jgi:glycosyltransferase involved in cell wall biosynthesis
MAGRVIYLVRSWPRLSQTFIVNEVLGLERRGVELSIVSLVRSDESIVQPQVRQVTSPVTYLDDRRNRGWWAHLRTHATALRRAPLRYLRTLGLCLGHPGLAKGYGELNARQCFHEAVTVACQEWHATDTTDAAVHVHAHFAHDPALVGMFVARLLGLPFTFTGHARDLLQIPARSLARRASEATSVVTCCEENARYIRSVVPADSLPPVKVIHHGVELARFVPAELGDDDRTPVLVSVGRMVEKKGFGDLLTALGRLHQDGVAFHCRIYGNGPLLDELIERRDSLGLRKRVQFMGAVSSPEIVVGLQSADAFALTPRVTADGDRDGIPNVLVEAMACALPAVTTSAGGITELVNDDVNGLVAASGDVDSMVVALRRVLTEPQTRRRLGAEARRTVEDDYDVDRAAEAMETVFWPGRPAVEEVLS